MRTSEHGRKGCYVVDITPNEFISGVFVITQAQQFQAKNGPFWRLSLQDASGNIDGKVWSPLAQDFSEFATGALYAVEGKSSLYKDKVELSLSSITYLPEEALVGIDLGDFVAVSPYPVDQMVTELRELFSKNISHPPLMRFFESLMGDEGFYAKFVQAPAAKAMHHAYAGGLLEHTLSICRLSMSIADNYPHVDRQILLTGALCHDLGKIWELTSGLSIDYTDEGRLVGHISLGLERITPYMQGAGLEKEYILHIQHLILSHHGAYEFGAPRLPATAEAFILHFADNIDAKLQQVAQALDDDANGPHWSSFVRGLDRQVYQASQIPQTVQTAQTPQTYQIPPIAPISQATQAPDAVQVAELAYDTLVNHGRNSTSDQTEGGAALTVDDSESSIDETAYMDALLKDSNDAYLTSDFSFDDELANELADVQDFEESLRSERLTDENLASEDFAGEDFNDESFAGDGFTGEGVTNDTSIDGSTVEDWSTVEMEAESVISDDSALNASVAVENSSLESDAVDYRLSEAPVVEEAESALATDSFEDTDASFSMENAVSLSVDDGQKMTEQGQSALASPESMVSETTEPEQVVPERADSELFEVEQQSTEQQSVEQAKTAESQAEKKQTNKGSRSKQAKAEQTTDEGELEAQRKQKSKPTPPKQPSLPLLEQCSLLSKE